MLLRLEHAEELLRRIEESDKAISGAVARDKIMWSQTGIFMDIGLQNKALMQQGMSMYNAAVAKMRVDMTNVVSDFMNGRVDTAGAISRFKSFTSRAYQDVFKAGAVAMGNPYYADPAIGLTKKDLAFISSARRYELSFFKRFLLDMSNPNHRPAHPYLQRAGYYADSAKSQFYNGMVNGAGENVEIKWVMGNVEEHCHDCPILASKTYTWQTLPTTPGAGDTECLYNCKCHLEFQRRVSGPVGGGVPMPTGSGTATQSTQLPGRWSSVTSPSGQELTGTIVSDMDYLYSAMNKARQMITLSSGPEKADWIAQRKDINKEIIRRMKDSNVRVTPTISVNDLVKTVRDAQTKATGGVLTANQMAAGTEVLMITGDRVVQGIISLRNAQVYIDTAAGSHFAYNDVKDILLKIRGPLDPTQDELAIIKRMTKGTGLTDAKPTGDDLTKVRTFLNKQPSETAEVYRVIWMDTEADLTAFFDKYIRADGPRELLDMSAMQSWSKDSSRTFGYGHGGYEPIQFVMKGGTGQTKFVDVSRWSVYPEEQEARNLFGFKARIKSARRTATGWVVELEPATGPAPIAPQPAAVPSGAVKPVVPEPTLAKKNYLANKQYDEDDDAGWRKAIKDNDQAVVIKPNALSAPAKRELEEYIDWSYHPINKYLRHGDQGFLGLSPAEITTRAENLDQAFWWSKTARDIKLFRSAPLDATALRVGDTFVDKGFVSTSTQQTSAGGFMQSDKWHLEILVPKDTPAVAMTRVSGRPVAMAECEILLPRNCRFKVNEINEARKTIEVELVDINGRAV